MKIQIEKS